LIDLRQGDCLELMKTIPDKSIDAIICDLPYGTTACKWDSVIPFEPLWAQYKRVIKPNKPIVLFCADLFTCALAMSNPSWYKTKWIWNKKQSGSFANAKYVPLKITEDILVFADKGTYTYNPQMRTGKLRIKGGAKKSSAIQTGIKSIYKFNDQYFPTNILEYPATRSNRFHPTEKPVELMEYLVKTYTNQGDMVLDNCMGSGTTGVACKNLGRKFIGIEQEPYFFEIAKNRINV